MSAARDGQRVAALVEAVEELAKGRNMTVGEIAMKVFGWPLERVFLAIDAALEAKLIARSAPRDDAAPANDRRARKRTFET